MTSNSILRFIQIPFLIIAAFHLFSFKPFSEAKDRDHYITYENTNQDTANTFNDEFSIPELQVTPSPESEKSFTFKKSEKVTDYDISPAGPEVAALIEEPSGRCSIKFWKIDQGSLTDSCKLPNGLKAKAIAWHPNAKSFFVMGNNDSDYQIYRIERIHTQWKEKLIFSTSHPLRRLLVCPRPFITNNDTYSYRLFFGMDNGDKTFRIVSITDNGNRFYQVVGPSTTFTKNFDEATDADNKEEKLNPEDAPDIQIRNLDPSFMEAGWALPVAFHPGGHELIWQDNFNKFYVARYDSKYWGESRPLNIVMENKGTITPTPNGLGLIHWQKGKNGIGIYLLASKKEDLQLDKYQFISTPSSVPDGKGIVGLTLSNGSFTLNYLPVKVPLADVMNAWMFADSSKEVDCFEKHFGLFRPNNDDQLYKLYESENYYCNDYNRNLPTRPYLVTTDLFWELFGAAYEGLFIVKERDEAIPAFWKFVNGANQYIKSTNAKSSWSVVLAVLVDLNSNNNKNPEVQRILNEKDCYTEVLNDTYPYSNLKPRGHYTSSPEMAKYFKAFRYFTTILLEDQNALKELNTFSSEVTALAAKWISCYSGFIAPSRSPLIWNNIKQDVPAYCVYPQKEPTIFPLSWGFDNEVLYSSVFHLKVPSDLQVKGPSGYRLLPSGIDLAAALGNGLAENLLEADYQKYPPLRKVIGNLKENFKSNLNHPELKDNLYNQWINAVAIQWTDTVKSINGLKDNDIWQTKRLQTGLATWATLRHATVLVNERTAAECGEGGFEEILMRAPRGYVEPDPVTFAAIADLFESMVKYVSKTIKEKEDFDELDNSEQRSLYEGITKRLKEAAMEARAFESMAKKELRGEYLSNEENEKILYVARTGEHLFLIFNSLSNKDYALSNPDPMAKIADVAGDGKFSPYLLSAVGNAMEWNHIVPFYGRHQIVKGSIYSYYEFPSNQLLNDQQWREKVAKQDFLPWIKPYISNENASSMANTSY